MMTIKTHDKIDSRLCGTPVEIAEGYSRVALTTCPEMAADTFGLVHGGFIFGMADYAAMIAVNHPNVVLGGAEVRFMKPVRTGDALVAEAGVTAVQGKKHVVSVTVRKGDTDVFGGSFICFVLDNHVLG